MDRAVVIAKPQLVSVQDDANQARYIVEQVLANREQGMLLKQQATLFRASSHSAALELELTRRNIPFVKFGGLKFLEASHVKDVLAILRWTQNPRDRVSGFRALQLLEGVGPKIAARVLGRVQEEGGRLERARGDEGAALPATLPKMAARRTLVSIGRI